MEVLLLCRDTAQNLVCIGGILAHDHHGDAQAGANADGRVVPERFELSRIDVEASEGLATVEDRPERPGGKAPADQQDLAASRALASFLA